MDGAPVGGYNGLADGKPQTDAPFGIRAFAFRGVKHLLVLMVQMGISVEDIRKELASRHIIDHKVKQEKMTK